MNYRREIDGLRALAVVPVMLFHAGFHSFRGGFVGVDIFFVISGYLITSIIATELCAGRFSVLDFYERRARRILPALFFMLLCTVPLAWLWMLPKDFREFAWSLVAVPAFASNILFWQSSGYFDSASELKPLLHTWSLAVEEQYYLIVPLLLLLTWRLGRRWLLALLALLALASLYSAHLTSVSLPSFAFFMLPTRGWEILLGALIALTVQQGAGSARVGRGLAQGLSLLGLMMIGFSVFQFDSTTPWPGLHALVPTMGTGLILAFGHDTTLTGKLLGNRLLVGIGLISYSAYLWHQPVLALLRYRSLDDLSQALLVGCLLGILVLAALSHHFIERPFRSRDRLSRRSIFIWGLVGATMIASLGLTLERMSAPRTTETAPTEVLKLPGKVMLLGDSHAGHLVPGLESALRYQLLIRAYPGCIPLRDVDRYDSRFTPGDCAREVNRALTEFETSREMSLLILSSMGPVYLDGTPFKGKDKARVTGLGVELIDDPTEKDRWRVFETGMRRTLTRLTALPGKSIIFVLDPPELGIEDRHCTQPTRIVTVAGTRFGASNTTTHEHCRQSRADVDARTVRYHSLVRRVLTDFPGVILFDPTDLFCDADWCYGTRDGKKLYLDVDHLSPFGSMEVARRLIPVIREAAMANAGSR